MKLQCLLCDYEFDGTISRDKFGWHSVCPECGGSFTVDVPEGRIVMAFADDTRLRNCTAYLEDGVSVSEYFALDDPRTFLEFWKAKLDELEGAWYWLLDDDECFCSGLLDPEDRVIIGEHFNDELYPSVKNEPQEFELSASLKFKLTRQDIDDIMVSALEGGITYWAVAADVIEEQRVADWGHEQISRGGKLRIVDEDGTCYNLTRPKFLRGFCNWVEDGNDVYGAVQNGLVDTAYIDGRCADEIVQYALFGEIIYG